ncbi:GIY-YIG nuclease family protein [Sulfurovum sp.]|uniref:GIY-YIG nuclease family protein n=1 Tax=Sulfurovum sp. TaxID=1969726 RepID=UPI00286831B3|nr:GIY-YIG nuclease family protein [Sulfurovum sp.]
MKQGYIYIMSNKNNGTLYIGVTSNLIKRVYEHKNNFVDGFTKKYNLKILVYYEVLDDIQEAIAREKQLKSGSRGKKIELIESMNKEWNDLYESII